MKTVLLQNHSKNNESLYQMSLMNHVKYAAKHEYDMWQLNIPYQEALDPLNLIEDALQHYDQVFCFGSDVVITNFDIALSSFIQAGQGIAISREDIGYSQCNADTILFQRGEECKAVFEALRKRKPVWEKHPWGLQEGFNMLLQENPTEIAGFINYQPVRVMQSTIFTAYPSCWKETDFSLHFVGCHGEEKNNRMRMFLEQGKVWWRPGRLYD